MIIYNNYGFCILNINFFIYHLYFDIFYYFINELNLHIIIDFFNLKIKNYKFLVKCFVKTKMF
jgi:hypothetical protein